MGKDRRRKQTATSSSNETGSEPKGQREPRVRTQQRDVTKNTDTAVKVKTTDNIPIVEEETKKTEPINTEELFANLKRETDDIKALTAKKFAKRQIFSNWEKYEEPPPQPQYEVDIQGADFESLLEAPASGGGYFQFKSERSWDANVSALSGELFSLDVDLLAEGLATIPLYEKLDLPITLFSKNELENMDSLARTALKQYATIKENAKKTRDKNKDAKEITNRLLDIIKESSPAPFEKNPVEDKTILNFEIDQPDIQNEVDENVNLMDSYDSNNPYINDMPETNVNTGIGQIPPSSFKINEQPSTTLKSVYEVSGEPFKEKIQQDVLPSREIKKRTVPLRENKKGNVLNKQIKNEVEEEIVPVRETLKESTPPKDIRREQVTPIRDIKKESTSTKDIKREQVTPIKDIESAPPKDIKREQVTPIRDIKKESTPPKGIKREQVTPIRDIKKESTHHKEIINDVPEQVQPTFEEETVQEPAMPLGQRTGRRKTKVQSQLSENQNKTQVSISKNETLVSEIEKKPQVKESQKKSQPPENKNKIQVREIKTKTEDLETQKEVHVSENQVKAQQNKTKQKKFQQADDDLDFLLSLKKPVRESHLSGLQPSQAAKPSIEEDDASGPDDDLTLVTPQKQTEDLEDWLDSMLDD